MTDAGKPSRPGWVGPLFRWELVRLARRGQAARARSLLAIVVLLALLLFTVFWFARQGVVSVFLGTAQALTTQESANFGDRFATTFLLAQLVVMIFLTPAYAAGGIAEKKERKTLDFLVVSSLSNREIVVGKFLGRTVFLFGVLFTGLPILSLTFLYGGVDLGIVLATYALTAGTIAVVSAASLYAALSADGFRSAMFRAYGLTVLFAVVGFGCFYISPLFIFVSLQSLREDTVPFLALTIGYPIVELAIASILIALAIRQIRPAITAPMETAPRPRAVVPVAREANDLETSVARPIARPIARPVVRPIDFVIRDRISLPPIDDGDPFYWKERYTSLHGRTSDEDSLQGLKISAAIVAGFALILFGAIGLASAATGKGGDLLLAVATFGVLMQLVAIGADACGRIALERSRATLETLLSLPGERREILFAKWRVAVVRGVWWGVPCSLVVPACIAGSDLGAVAFPILGYQIVLIPAAAVLGLFLSIRCRSTARAMLFYLPIAGIAALAPAGIYVTFDAATFQSAMIAALLLMGSILVASGVLWAKINIDFERDGGGLDGGR